MSERLRLRAKATLRRIQNIGFPSQFIPYKKERVNERLALFWQLLRLSKHPRRCGNTSTWRHGFIA